MTRAARAAAALAGRAAVAAEDLRGVALLALRHRLHRDPLERGDSSHRILDAVEAHLARS